MNPVIPNVGVHHLAVRTRDYAKTLTFYTNVLGMHVRLEWTAADGRKLALLDLGNGSHIEVIGLAGDAPAVEGGQNHPWMHFALATSDPDVVWKRAIDAGCPSVIEPKDVVLGTLAARIAFFEGPNGEVIELFREQ